MKVQAKIQIKEGMPIEIDIFEDGLEIHKLQSEKKLTFPFSESELLKGITPRTAHADIISKSPG
ncbi:MAG: hypothetical protein WBE18_06170 [Gammaproteobacteria bacterium]